MPAPCVGGTSCGDVVSFDLANDNILLYQLGSRSSTTPPAPAGAWTAQGCRKGLLLPQLLGNFDGTMNTLTSVAQCLNLATASGTMAYFAISALDSYNQRSCRACSFADLAENRCVVDGPMVAAVDDCDALGGLQQHSMLYKLMLTSPSPPPNSMPPPPFPPLPSPYYPAALEGTNPDWYAAGAFFQDLSQPLSKMWTNLNCYWNIGTGSCIGPFSSTIEDSSSTRASIVKACQDVAATYGYDTVTLRKYRRRPGYDYVLSADCYACKGCTFFSGGPVPATATCGPPAVFMCDDAYDGPGCSSVTTAGCTNVAGCTTCANSTSQQSRVNQVYRQRPAGALLAPAPPPISKPPNPPPPPAPATCPPFSLSGGANATCVVTVPAGYKISAGTSIIPGSVCVGDTYLTLIQTGGWVRGINDDAIGKCSWLSYRHLAAVPDNYTIVQQCYGATTCSGTVAYTLTNP